MNEAMRDHLPEGEPFDKIAYLYDQGDERWLDFLARTVNFAESAGRFLLELDKEYRKKKGDLWHSKTH